MIQKGRKKKAYRQFTDAVAHIKSTFNNTIITITDRQGNTVAWASPGSVGYKGSRKSTPYAAQLAGEKVGMQIRDMGITNLDIFVRGPGSGREAAIRALHGCGFQITNITDITPLPHNGCRPPKQRRG
ncbi:MAG: 30S ribosomal protein S11 [Gammaproteobacteria bacterium]